MKHVFLGLLFPMALTAQPMSIIDQLGKTVLYGDVALSPDGKNVPWVQSTTASTSKQTYLGGTSRNTSPTVVKIPAAAGERTDFDPAWSPDSKTIAVFSSAGQKEQRQLWIVNADGADPKKITDL